MNEFLKISSDPFVSVIMPVYNGERYIEQSIRSVIMQTYSNWELIVIDDFSSDSTAEIVKALCKEDKRVRYVKNSQNIGTAKTRNRGLDLCKGDFVALLDSDDIWYPEKLEKQLALAESTEADIVYCSYGIIDEYGEKLCNDFIVPETTTYEKTLIRSVISCSTALFTRNIVDKYRFRTDYYHEDLIMWIEMMRDGNRAFGVTEVIADYRVSRGSRTSNKFRTVIERWKIYRKLMKEPFFRSVKLITDYALLALKKYKRV